MGGKAKLAKATKESLMARAQQAKENQKQYQEYESELLEMTLMIKRLPMARICDIMDMHEGDSMKESMDLNNQIVYESIPLLQDKELQTAYGCVEPHDIVPKVFEENVGEIEKICKVIMSTYGMGDQIESLKN